MTDKFTVIGPGDLDEPNAAVVDVRDRRSFADVGHVPGAVNVPADSFRDPSSVSTGKLPAREAFEALLGERGSARPTTSSPTTTAASPPPGSC